MPPDGLIRYLHAAYAAPETGASDAELLRRCAAAKDDAAFELLVRRYADMVWRVCRAVARDHHTAEDAFQATFLALARRPAAVGRGPVGGWLYRVGYHAALKARVREQRQKSAVQNVRRAEPPTRTEAEFESAELAAAIHEELNRMADKYRLPLLLCYFDDRTHAEAAAALGWPVGTVATRVARGRNRLRDRLTRRGVGLPAGGVAAVLAVGPASALPLPLVPAVVRNATPGAAVPPAVNQLTREVLTMTRSAVKLRAVAAVLALTAGTAFALGALADPPKPDEGKAPPAGVKETKLVDTTRAVDPGVAALAAASTDIVTADVLDTSPRRAIEGARDTVKLKVVRSLLGRLAADDEIGVYYHLLWRDEAGTVLEPPRFDRGKRYVVFLKSHPAGPAGGPYRQVYEPTDQWLWVQPDNARLVKDTAAAVRVRHGDARGEWSAPVGPLQARLVVYRDAPVGGTPILRVMLDVRNVAGSNNTVEFLLDEAKAAWSVTGPDGKPGPPTSPPGDGYGLAKPRKLTLAAQEEGRLPLTISWAGIVPNGGGHLELGPDRVWEFGRTARGPYALGGTITIAPTGQRERWSGTLELPKVRIPLGED